MSTFLDALGFRNLDPDTAARLDDIAAETVVNNALRVATADLAPSARETAYTLWRSGTAEELIGYFAESNVEFDRILAEETVRYIDTLQRSGKIIRGEDNV